MTLRRFAKWSFGIVAALVVALCLFVAWRTSYAVPPIAQAVLVRDYAETQRLLDAGHDVNSTAPFPFLQDLRSARQALPRPMSNQLGDRIAAVFYLTDNIELLEIAGDTYWGKSDWRLSQLLVERGASMQGRGSYLVFMRALYDHSTSGDLTELMVRRGYDVNRTDFLGPPLHLAAQHGKLEAVRYLLDRGAKVEAIVKPWSLSKPGGSTVEASGVWFLNNYDAPKENAAAILRLLLEHGFPLDARTPADFQSLLHVAVKLDDLEFVDYLLARNIDRSLRDLNGRTALELAREMKLSPLVARLESAAADAESK